MRQEEDKQFIINDSFGKRDLRVSLFAGLILCKTVLFVLSRLSGFLHLGAGLAVGLSGLAAGFAIGVVGDAGVRGTAQQPRYTNDDNLSRLLVIVNL